MGEVVQRRRGRPKRSIVVPPDVLALVWVNVQLVLICERIRTGKTPSVSRACRLLAAQGGIVSVVGGNRPALVRANAKRKKSWHRLQPPSSGSKLRPNAQGTIFASHMITHAPTLGARYSAANVLASSSRLVRLAWMNLGRQMLGRPIKKPRWGTPLGRTAWRVGSQGNIVAN
jgi:hypothetical protein